MDQNAIKTALVVAAVIALTIYVNKNYLKIEDKISLPA